MLNPICPFCNEITFYVYARRGNQTLLRVDRVYYCEKCDKFLEMATIEVKKTKFYEQKPNEVTKETDDTHSYNIENTNKQDESL